jgi:hypothetical protein
VEGKIRNRAFAQVTILATLARSLSNKFASPCIHALVVRAEVNAPCFDLHEVDDLRIVETRPILGIFFFRKGS